MSRNSGYFILTFLFVVLSVILIKCTNKPLAKGVSLHQLFSDHMVMQQNKPVLIWGKASNEGRIIVQMDGISVQTEVDDKGNWMTKHPSMKAGGPYTVKVISADTLILSDVYIGDVWICSGQSNMEWPLSEAKNAEHEIATADYPLIRLLKVERGLATLPQWDCTVKSWEICSPKTAPNFSAVGYFFGRELYKTGNIPIGLIQSAWGGTKIQGWISKQGYKKIPKYHNLIQRVQSKNLKYKNINELNKTWLTSLNGKDIGVKNPDSLWFNPLLNESGWKSIKLPMYWENSMDTSLQNYDGVVWFRRNFTLPDSWNKKGSILSLGPIDDHDSTWLNGHLIGSEAIWDLPRKYKIPNTILKTGKNQLTVRVLDIGGPGGIWTINPMEMRLTNRQGNSIQLSGNWNFKIGIPEETMPPHASTSTPTMLFNAMIHPLIPYGIRGVIWYQGESNTSESFHYRTLFPALINDWRQHWKQDEFPFYFVQLANFMKTHSQPCDNDWAELREAQMLTLATNNTGMVVTIDIGEADNIHPRNKQDVGKRLAFIARNKIFGENIFYSGPIYRSMQIEGDKIRIFFDHTAGGLITPNGSMLKGFSIAEDDKKFLWADAKLDGETVVVSHSAINKPVAVRYAWDANPQCNLYNLAKLPASPFRTDDWKLLTEPDK